MLCVMPDMIRKLRAACLERIDVQWILALAVCVKHYRRYASMALQFYILTGEKFMLDVHSFQNKLLDVASSLQRLLSLG